MRIVKMGDGLFGVPFFRPRFNNRKVEQEKKRKERKIAWIKLRCKREDRIWKKEGGFLIAREEDRMFNRVQSSIQSNSILFWWVGEGGT